VTSIDFQATLEEARDTLDKTNAEALFVTRGTVPGLNRVYGIVTRSEIESHYTV